MQRKKLTTQESQINAKVYHKYQRDRAFVLFPGDCQKLLRTIPDEHVDLTLTSPPYCLGKDYESSTSVDDFVATHSKILPEIFRVTKPGGSICWQVGYHVKARSVVPLDYLVYDIARGLPGLTLRNRIIWSFGHGLHESERFTGRHETILWFTKGSEYHFDLDAVRIPQRYPGKKHYKGPNKGQFSGNPMGKNPTDVWDIPNVKANHKEKTAHPCQFPIGLAQRLIKSLCPIGGLVLDPFTGSGTTGAAAALNCRRFVGAELDEVYSSLARERIAMALSGTLAYRAVDEPVMNPAHAGSVAQKPSHFTWQHEEEEELWLPS